MAHGNESSAQVEKYKTALRKARRHIIENGKMRHGSDADILLSVKYIDDALPPEPYPSVSTVLDLAHTTYDQYIGLAQPMTTAPQDGRWIEILAGDDKTWHRVRWDGHQWATEAKDGILSYVQPHTWRAIK